MPTHIGTRLDPQDLCNLYSAFAIGPAIGVPNLSLISSANLVVTGKNITTLNYTVQVSQVAIYVNRQI